MSYDVAIMKEVDGEMMTCQDCGNMTANVGKMYYTCLREMGYEGRLSAWDGKPAYEFLPYAEGIIQRMKDDPKRFEAMNPDNGWGSYEGALKWMQEIRKAILLSPDDAIIHWYA